MSRLRLRLMSGSLLAQPTLTNFSALGTAPVTLQWSTSDYVAGMRAQLQIDTNSGFTTVPLPQNIIFFIDGASWALNDMAIGMLDPAGLYYARIRTVRDNATGTLVTGNDPLGNALSFNADVSRWSTTFSDTIVSSTAAWTGITGTKKHSTLTVSGTPVVIMQGTAGQGFLQDVAATIAGGNKTQWEHTTTTLATDTNRAISFGRYNGTTDLSANNARPGVSDANGYTITYTPGSTSVFVFDNSATTIGNFTLGSAAALGDVWTDEIDITGAGGTHVLTVYRNGTSVGSCTAQTLTGFNIAWAGVQSNEKLTANFGGTSFTHALNSGFAFYG